MSEYNEEVKQGKSLVYWLIGLCVVLSIIGFIWQKSKDVTDIDDAVQNYEQYQELFNTCTKINRDLCNMKDLPENDKMFEQFSKAQRILQLKTNLNRWIEDYNAKSKMWGRSLWKSSSLPYQLTNEQFNCNN